MKKDFSDFPPIGNILISKQITKDGKKPGFLYRNKRLNQEDSGWCIFSGFESESYTDDENNIDICSPLTVLEIDPELENILLCGFGSVFEKSRSNGNWKRVTDWNVDDDYIIEQKIDSTWKIKINNLFEKSIEDKNQVLFTTGDKSLRIANWKFDGSSKEELIKEHHDTQIDFVQEGSKRIEYFDFSSDNISRLGYTLEEKDSRKSYKVLYAFNIMDGLVLQQAYYFDNDDDKNWAIKTWKTIEHIK